MHKPSTITDLTQTLLKPSTKTGLSQTLTLDNHRPSTELNIRTKKTYQIHRKYLANIRHRHRPSTIRDITHTQLRPSTITDLAPLHTQHNLYLSKSTDLTVTRSQLTDLSQLQTWHRPDTHNKHISDTTSQRHRTDLEYLVGSKAPAANHQIKTQLYKVSSVYCAKTEVCIVQVYRVYCSRCAVCSVQHVPCVLYRVCYVSHCVTELYAKIQQKKKPAYGTHQLS